MDGFSFSYVFDSSFKWDRASRPNEYNNIDWFLELELMKNDEVAIILYGGPNSGVFRPNIPWQITFNLSVTIGGKTLPEMEAYLCNNQTDEHLIGTPLFKGKIQDITEESITVFGGIPVTVKMSNIRTLGIRKFKTIDFLSKTSSSDLILAINDLEIYCHKHILSMNSPAFARMIDGLYKPTILDRFLSIFIPYTPVIALDPKIAADEFLELLHHLYYPSETIDDYNFGTLLHWGTNFEVVHVIEFCQQTMKSRLLYGPHERMLDYFFLACTYNLGPLKESCVDLIFEQETLVKHMSSSQHYHEIAVASRLEILERVVSKKFQKALGNENEDESDECDEDMDGDGE